MKLAARQFRTVFGQDVARDLASPGVSRWEVSTTVSPISTKEALIMWMDAWLTFASESSNSSEVGPQPLVMKSNDRTIVVGPVRLGRMIVSRYRCNKDIQLRSLFH